MVTARALCFADTGDVLADDEDVLELMIENKKIKETIDLINDPLFETMFWAMVWGGGFYLSTVTLVVMVRQGVFWSNSKSRVVGTKMKN